MDNIVGRTAFVTGGASGIGLGIAEALIGAGARVVIADWDDTSLTSEAERLGPSAFPVHLDVTERSEWAEAKRLSEEAFGPVEILINNAGVAPDWNELVDMPEEHFDRLIAIMLTGVFNGVRTFVGAMRTRAEGHVVNMSSMVGLIGAARQGAYVAAKFAIVGFSETLRIELQPHGVGVSVVCPGRVRSNLLAGNAPTHKLLDDGMDPSTCAAQMLAAIRQNDLYVITHPEHRSLIAARSERLLSAFE